MEDYYIDFKKFIQELMKHPDKAKKFVQDIGIYDKNMKLTKKYQ